MGKKEGRRWDEVEALYLEKHWLFWGQLVPGFAGTHQHRLRLGSRYDSQVKH